MENIWELGSLIYINSMHNPGMRVWNGQKVQIMRKTQNLQKRKAYVWNHISKERKKMWKQTV